MRSTPCPKRRCALQLELDKLAQHDSLRVVVIAAAGKAFCADHDLREMRASPSHDYDQALFKQAAKLMISIQQLPVIAGVHGIATAASCQLVTMCDLAAATGSASDSTRLRDWLWRTPN